MSYAKWQQKLGYGGADADGWPGKSTWDQLRVPKSWRSRDGVSIDEGATAGFPSPRVGPGALRA